MIFQEKLPAITAVAFNHRKAEILASGDSSGVISVWRFGNAALVRMGNEEEYLGNLSRNLAEK